VISEKLQAKLDDDLQRQIKKEKEEVRRVKAKLRREKSTAQLIHFIERYRNTAAILKAFLNKADQDSRKRQLEDVEKIIDYAKSCLVKLRQKTNE
jgi:hypothetical protein